MDLREIAQLGVGTYSEDGERPQAGQFVGPDTLLVVGDMKSIDTWNLASGDLTRHKVRTKGFVRAALSPDGGRFAAIGFGGAVWELGGWTELFPLKAKSGGGIAFSDDGQTLYFCDQTKVHALDVNGGAPKNAWPIPKADKGYSFGGLWLSPDGASVYAHATDYQKPDRLYRFEADGTGAPVASASLPSLSAVWVGPGGQVVCAGPRPALLDPTSLAPIGAFDLEGAPPSEESGLVGFVTPDLLLTQEMGSYDTTWLAIWSSSERRCVGVLDTMNGAPIPSGQVVVGDGGRLAIFCRDRVVVAALTSG